MQIKIIKFDNDFKLPERAHYNDSGADIFSVEDVNIKPNSTYAVRTGIGLYLPDGYDATVCCKSGLSSKGIFSSNAPIDCGYTGEIHAILYNSSNKDFYVHKGMKVGQIVIRPVIYANFIDSTSNSLERGSNGFGSTGK